MLLQITFAQGCANFYTSPSIILDRMLQVIVIRSLKNARQRGADLDTSVIIIVLSTQVHVENPGALWVHVYLRAGYIPRSRAALHTRCRLCDAYPQQRQFTRSVQTGPVLGHSLLQ